MITFEHAYLDPINVDDKSKLLSIFHSQGFAIIDGKSFPDTFKPENKLEYIEKKYRLGSFEASDEAKALYGERLKDGGYNNIVRPSVDVKLKHDAFDTNNGQAFHVDGILRPSGLIKTVVLTCKNQAQTGGENTLFNMVAAIEHIKKLDPELLKPLYDKRSMRRVSDYEGNNRHSCDSILHFDEQYQRTVINFSMDSTVDWQFSEMLVPGIGKPVSILKSLSELGLPFTLSVNIKKGDTIIMDNGLVAHGRTDFIDTEDNPRIMVRGKYEVLPS